MSSITFSTIKGGVGKTTLSAHVAAALADRGLRVLFLDLDPQGHASLLLGLEPGDKPSLADAFGPKPKLTLDKVVVPSPKRPELFIAPACARIAAMERDLHAWGHRLQAIPRAMKTLSWQPDAVVVDTPPSIGAYTEAALAYAEVVASPVPASAFALQGLSDIDQIRRDVRDGAGQLVVAVNMWDRRTAATNAAMEGALEELNLPVLDTRISRAEGLNQAGLAYELIFDQAPSSPVAKELRDLAAELGARAGLWRRPRTVAARN
ncbi:MAG: ParA family protein [Myxococcaceae bacterium]